MNILFLGLSSIESFEERGIYSDLLRCLIKKGKTVFSVTSIERRKGIRTHLNEFGNSKLLLVKTFNIQKTNMLEKGLGTLAIKNQYIRAINKFYKGIKFDLILYPTPPITLCGVVEYYKKRDKAKTYLMLKDIFPQNAVDIGLMKTNGVKGLIYKYFRRKEKKLYFISDRIGCMSPANVDYLINHNPEINKNKVEVFPNCIEPQKIQLSLIEKERIKKKYGLPTNKKIFIYGGNLGKPQGIPFIIECLKFEKNNDRAFFLIVGDGTEYAKLDEYYKESKQKNFLLLNRLSTKEFDKLLLVCDIGMIFLDYHFTIPNFPSRVLSYMQAGLPVFACTDENTDVGKIITKEGLGWWCSSNSVHSFNECVNTIINDSSDRKNIIKQYLLNNYDVNTNYIKLELEHEN